MREQKYRQEWLRLRNRYERRGVRAFRKALQDVANRVEWDQADPWNYRMLIESNVNEMAILETYQAFYVEIGLLHGQRIGKAINKYKKSGVKEFDPVSFRQTYPSEVLQFIRNSAGNNIVSVRKSVVKYLLDFIEKGLKAGESVREMARLIQRHILSKGFYRWQIKRIVQTETTAAANYGSYKAGISSDLVMVKTWISATDERTRRIEKGAHFDHLEMNLKEVDEDVPFEVVGKFGNDLLDFPGDPKGKAGNVINCRCNLAMVPKLDANGDFIERTSTPRFAFA